MKSAKVILGNGNSFVSYQNGTEAEIKNHYEKSKFFILGTEGDQMQKVVSCEVRTDEICNECGVSVKFGSGHYVNRVPDLNDIETRLEMGKPFPHGEFICSKCDNKIHE